MSTAQVSALLGFTVQGLPVGSACGYFALPSTSQEGVGASLDPRLSRGKTAVYDFEKTVNPKTRIEVPQKK